MSPKRVRVLLAGAVVAAAVGALLLTSVRGGLVYYVTPQELVQGGDRYLDKAIRLGGFVVPGTLRWDRERLETTFQLRDEADHGSVAVTVVHHGAPPDLFREGKGAVVEGRWDGQTFQSTTILVKHSEEYRPPAGEKR